MQSECRCVELLKMSMNLFLLSRLPPDLTAGARGTARGTARPLGCPLAVPPHFGGREQHPQLGSEVLLASRAALLQPSSPHGRGAACRQALLLTVSSANELLVGTARGGQCWGALFWYWGSVRSPCPCCLVRGQCSESPAGHAPELHQEPSLKLRQPHFLTQFAAPCDPDVKPFSSFFL